MKFRRRTRPQTAGPAPARSGQRRALALAALLVAALGGALAVTVAAVPSVSAAPTAGGQELPAGWVMTASGPLSPADRDLIVRVRLAGLWEAPVGQQAQQRARSPQVKHVGEHLAAEHLQLDVQVRAVAAQLGVELPNQPSAEQQGWLAELSGKSGDDFDTTFVARLRTAHGKVFALVCAVRAGTRNEVVRAFAETAVDVVMRHMAYLESTGLVDYATLPAPVPPSAGTPPATLGTHGHDGPDLPVVWIVLAVAAVAGAVVTVRVIRPR